MTQLKVIINNNLNVLLVPCTSDGIPMEPIRIVNGRGGRAPGFENLNIDIYPPLVFATLYCEYTDDEIVQICDVLKTIFTDQPILVQDRSVRPPVTRMEYGKIPEEFIVEDAGLRFFLNPRRGQNPGFFPDMRNGRSWIRDNILPDSDVLNLFSYTCALSVAALSAGASKVVNIDKNKRSLDIGRRNHRLNHGAIPGGYRAQALFLPHDIFKSIGKLKKEGPYDLIIADPPPSQKGSFILHKDYPRLIRRLPEMLKPGGRIMLTLNSPGWSWEDFEDMVREHLPEFICFERLLPPADFAPIEDGRGLKIIIVEV